MRRILTLLLLLTACQPSAPVPEAADALAADLAEKTTLEPVSSEIEMLSATAPANLEARQAEEPQSTPTQAPIFPGFQLCSPLTLHGLSNLRQVIGDPYDPPRPGREERHHGIDFAYYHFEDRDSMQGELIQAVLAGVVASALHDLYPYGNMVMIETVPAGLPVEVAAILGIRPGESLYILYAHMDADPAVDAGDEVEACQPLGEVGMTGNTELPHLHLETRLGPAGSVFESMRYYDTRASLEELHAYELWRTSGVYRHFDPMKLLSIPLDPSLPLLANP